MIIIRSSLQGDPRFSQQMNVEERLVADYVGTGLTVGKRPMHYRRPELRRSNILSAEELRSRLIPNAMQNSLGFSPVDRPGDIRPRRPDDSTLNPLWRRSSPNKTHFLGISASLYRIESLLSDPIDEMAVDAVSIELLSN